MKKIALFFTILLFIGTLASHAQTRMITGTVTSSEDEMPIPGVSISVKGTTLGTVTDLNGEFSIDVPEEAQTLVFSFIGMGTREINITSGNTFNVVMSPDILGIDEVMVVAYGTTSREAKTGSVTQVSSEQIADVPVSSFDKVLSGKLAGVTVTATSGQPGAASQIRIRGTSSINAGNEPLYVIDGVPVMTGDQSYFTNTSNALSMLNPNDIESITVLKDAAASSIYGSRAANGVVLVTTKSGQSGKTRFSVRAKYGVSQLANDNNYGNMTPEQLLTYFRDGVRNAGDDPDNPANAGENKYFPRELLSRPLTNWMDEYTRLGKNQEYEISANGGSDKTKYFSSASYHESEGVYYGVSFEKLQFRANVDHTISDRFKMGTRVNAAYTESNDVAMQSLYYANPAFAGMLILPWTPFYDENGDYNLNIPENAYTNPRATAAYDDQWEKQYRFLGTMFLEWEPITGLKFKTNNSAELTSGEGRRYWSDKAQYQPSPEDVALQTSTTLYRQLTTSNTLDYTNSFNDVHNLRIMAGQEATTYDYWSYYVWAPGVDPDMPYLNTTTSDSDDSDYGNTSWTLLSYFGNLDYNYNGKYYFQASYRADGSSRFGADTKWGNFYSVGASWNIHQESFMDNFNWIDLLKLRTSYGINGNNEIGNYEQYGVYGARQYNGVSGLGPDNLANPELSWELNTSYNIGLDFNIFKRLSGNIDLYKRVTSDMLLNKPLSRTTGFTSITTNIGELSNKGIELQLEGNILQGELTWDMSMNIARNISEVIDLAGNEQIESYSSRMFYVVGERLYTYYLYDYEGVDPVTGNALWRTEDGQLTSDYNKARRYYAGSPEPDWYGGLSTRLTWKGLSLNMAMEYKIGNEVLIEENRYLTSDGYNWNSNQVSTALNYWTTPGEVAVNPKPIYNNSTNSSGFRNTRWMQRGDYLRLKDVTLSYKVPKRFTDQLNLGTVKIYGSGYNIYTFHDVDFWDPERGVDGMGFGIYPMTKTLVFGLDIMF